MVTEVRAYLLTATIAIERVSAGPRASRRYMRLANADYDKASQAYVSFIAESQRAMDRCGHPSTVQGGHGCARTRLELRIPIGQNI